MADVLPKDVLLRVGGRTLHVTGYLAAMGAGGGYQEVKETFTRADGGTPLATFVDRAAAGVQTLRRAEAGKVRIEYPIALSGLVDQFGYPYCGPSLEGTRTNPCLWSEDLSQAGTYSYFHVSITADGTVAPDGQTTADKVVEDATTNAHAIFGNIRTITDGQITAASIFLKAGERSKIRCHLLDDLSTTGRWADVDLTTGTIANTGVTGSPGALFQPFTIQAFGNGWYRLSVAFNVGAGKTTTMWNLHMNAVLGTDSYAGDGTSGLYVWGWQIEVGQAFISSYLKTAGSLITRAADSLSVPLNGGPFDMSALVRWARPLHADAAGDIGIFPNSFVVGNRAANGSFESSFSKTTRDITSEWWWTPASATSKFAGALPAGNELIFAHQLKAPTTAPQVTLDVTGGGMLSFSSAGTGLTKFGGQTVTIGIGVYAILLDFILVRGLRTRAELLAIR